MQAPEPNPGIVADLLVRASDRESFARWQAQVRAAGACQQPVRLAGTIDLADTSTGELGPAPVLDTDGEPDGIVLKACGTRRAARCTPCAEVYRRDAWHLLAAGLRGGKGVPDAVAAHPRVFATFTAPSFGPVHSRRERGGTVHPCYPARGGARCPHGRRLACWHRHLEDDPVLGTPLCADCFDYQGAVLWNQAAPELWRRTTIYLPRALAALTGTTPRRLAGRVRVAYAKVAEFQRRGLVHYHAVIRLDGRRTSDPDAIVAPPEEFTAELLAAAIRRAAKAAAVPLPALSGGPAGVACWGEQLDLRPIRPTGPGAGGGELSAEQVAAYVAKYATKATESFGAALDRPIRSRAGLAHLDVPAHVAALVRACWQLGGRRELAHLKLRRWAHMLGYRGHFTSKSRRYSTTFRALRAARRAWVARRRHGPTVALDRDGRVLPPEGGVLVAVWAYQGRGYTTPGDAWLARSMGQQAREMRRIAREELTAVA